MFRGIKEDRAVLYALLSFWICVIIFHVNGTRQSRETVGTHFTGLPTVIIDPGHGGMDGGAVSVTGKYESDINWDTAVRVRDLLQFTGFRTVMTRDRQEIVYPEDVKGIASRKKWDTRQRVEYINSFDKAVLISIHQNYYPSAQPWGAQVLYAQNEPSRFLGEALQSLLSDLLQPENRRVAAPVGKEIYILNHVNCTAVLLECGFLSNPREAPLLETAPVQKKTAAVIAAALYRFAGDEHA